MERVLGLGGVRAQFSSRIAGQSATAAAGERRRRRRRRARSGRARGAAVHALLEWSQANGWREPSEELARRHARRRRARPRAGPTPTALLEPVRGWLGSPLLRERIAAGATRVRAEVPILLGVGDTVLRGSIDLLVEREGAPPLVVDYKTDRLDGSDPAEHAARYETQRTIYALAVAESLGADRGRGRLRLPRAPRGAGPHPPRRRRDGGRPRAPGGDDRPHRPRRVPGRPGRERDWALCRGCPALGRLCSGPERRRS